MRDEGGCPFVHFDHEAMLSTLSPIVASNDESISKISALQLRNQPMEACSSHMCSLIESSKQTEDIVKFRSPVEYYFNMKKCLNKSLQWQKHREIDVNIVDVGVFIPFLTFMKYFLIFYQLISRWFFGCFLEKMKSILRYFPVL